MKLIIRDYQPINEEEWLKCHALVYLGSNERILERNKPKYHGKTIELIALSNKKL